MRIDELEATLDRLEAEGRRPKFIYTIPTFQNPGGVTMSLPRRRRLVRGRARARAARARGQPLRPAALRGRAAADAATRSTAATSSSTSGTFSKILSPGLRLGWAVGAAPVLEKMNLGKQGSRPVLVVALAAVRRRVLRRARRWRTTSATLRELYRRRRDVMLDALAEHLPPEATWTRPQGGLFIWATLPDYIDTTDLLARALRSNVAFVPGRAAVPRRARRLVDAAELLRRRRGRHPRGRAAHRRGHPRAGRALRDADRRRAAAPRRERRPPRRADRLAERARSCRAASGAPTARRVSTVAVLKGGRSLERQVSLRSGARVEDALERLGHDVVGDRRRRRPRRAPARRARPTSAFVALHGRDGEDGTVQELLEVLGIPYTG